ncbi:MAG: M14 family zinc carboxypeptidase, partial [Candidatus Hodarchaeota archaeon]
MKTLWVITGFILIFTIPITYSYTLILTSSRSESINSIEFQSNQEYPFIWEEFEDAPGDQSGDDSVVFGPSFGPYHNYSELVYKLKKLNTTYPEIIQVFSIGKTYFGREIYCVRITNESITLPKTEVVIVSQHHAQEQINVEEALYFIEKVVVDFYSSSTTIQTLLNTKAIYVIPSLNIDGAEFMSQNPWQRKTLRPIDEDGDGIEDEYEVQDINGDGYVERMYDESGNFIGDEGMDLDEDGQIGNDKPGGVDPNRNYAFNFGKIPGASDNPTAWNYHGPYAFSENCTTRFRDFVLTRNFVTAVSLHSGMQYTMILGPSHEGAMPGGIDRDLYISTGTKLEELTGFTLEMEGGIYATSGVWDDWMYSNGNLLAFTFETYGNPEAYSSDYNAATRYYHHRGVWDFCNPPGDRVIENCVQTYQGLLFMVEEAPYLSIQTKNKEVGKELQIEVTVTNPSNYIRTYGRVSLNWTVSQATGVSQMSSFESPTPVRFGELEAKSSEQDTIKLSIDQPNYSLHIKLQVEGPKVGTAVLEYDLDSSQTTSESTSVPLIGVIGII